MDIIIWTFSKYGMKVVPMNFLRWKPNGLSERNLPIGFVVYFLFCCVNSSIVGVDAQKKEKGLWDRKIGEDWLAAAATMMSEMWQLPITTNISGYCDLILLKFGLLGQLKRKLRKSNHIQAFSSTYLY